MTREFDVFLSHMRQHSDTDAQEVLWAAANAQAARSEIFFEPGPDVGEKGFKAAARAFFSGAAGKSAELANVSSASCAADIFISYANQDRDLRDRVIALFGKLGVQAPRPDGFGAKEGPHFKSLLQRLGRGDNDVASELKPGTPEITHIPGSIAPFAMPGADSNRPPIEFYDASSASARPPYEQSPQEKARSGSASTHSTGGEFLALALGVLNSGGVMEKSEFTRACVGSYIVLHRSADHPDGITAGVASISYDDSIEKLVYLEQQQFNGYYGFRHAQRRTFQGYCYGSREYFCLVGHEAGRLENTRYTVMPNFGKLIHDAFSLSRTRSAAISDGFLLTVAGARRALERKVFLLRLPELRNALRGSGDVISKVMAMRDQLADGAKIPLPNLYPRDEFLKHYPHLGSAVARLFSAAHG